MTSLALGGAQARERLVEQQHRRPRRQRQTELEPALLAIGKRVDDEIGACGEVELLDQRSDDRLDLGEAFRRTENIEPHPAALAAQSADAQILAHRQLREQLIDLVALGQCRTGRPR